VPRDPDAEARYLLPAAQSEQIFQDHVVPLLGSAAPQEHPVVVVLTAQPGAGKTTLTAALRDRLAARGGVVSVEIDMLKPSRSIPATRN
jgi:pantothenate kinase-related protein Tda10